MFFLQNQEENYDAYTFTIETFQISLYMFLFLLKIKKKGFP